ncbi:hypothetical protein Tco_0139117 [Tanacetum coccineum]
MELVLEIKPNKDLVMKSAMMYVDGTVCKDFRVGRKRPPTSIWTKELLKERELVEIKSEGLGKVELVGPYVEEQDDPMPGNLEKDVVLKEHLLLQKRCRGLDSPRYQLGPQTQAIVFETADKQYKESECKKLFDFSDIPSFSLGFTQEDYDMEAETRKEVEKMDEKGVEVFSSRKSKISPTNEVMVRGRRAVTLMDHMKSPFYVRVVNVDKVENNEEKRLANILFKKRDGDESDVLFETISWSVYLNFMEEKKDSSSPAILFFSTFEVAENANSSYGGQTMLEKADIVFIPVSNVQQKFLLCVNLKNPVVTLIDSKKEGYKVTRKKKKNDDIDDMRVASILQRIFGQYLYAINHVKAVQIIECQIVRGNFTWQTDRRAKDYRIFLMRHMECYMGSDIGKWKCDLDVEGKKQNIQLGRLRNKYAAKLLLSDCNIYKDKIRKEIDGK